MVGLLLPRCANVTIADHEFCGSLGAQGAFCAHLLTNDTRTLSLQQFAAYWDDLTDPKVATSISTITDWKADIENLCTDSGDCSEQMEAQVNTLYNKISAAHAAATKAVGK